MISSGAAAERRACRFLRRQGLELVERNFRCRFGEIDLVMRDRADLVFVEVRFRGTNRLAPAGVTVDTRKQHRLVRTGAMFLATRSTSHRAVRFDVVAIDRDRRDGESIEWIRDAFRPHDSML